jgi:hypothetical protein
LSAYDVGKYLAIFTADGQFGYDQDLLITAVNVGAGQYTVATALGGERTAGLPVRIGLTPYTSWQLYTRYPDNLPCSRHTYYGPQILERHNRLLVTCGAISVQGTGSEFVEAFDLAANGNSGWDMYGTYPATLGNTQGGLGPSIVPAICKHPITEHIYVIENSQLQRLVPSRSGPNGAIGSGATREFLRGGLPAGVGAFTSTCVDQQRNRLVGFTPNTPSTARSIDLSGAPYTVTDVVVIGPAANAFSAIAVEAMGLLYYPRTDCFYAIHGEANPTVYRIRASDFYVDVLPTTGGSDIEAQGGSSSAGYGIYSKWMVSPNLGGIVYIVGSQFDVRFLRIE